MIAIKKNNNFPKWIQVFSCGRFVDEVQSHAKARRIATKLAKEQGEELICDHGKAVRIKS